MLKTQEHSQDAFGCGELTRFACIVFNNLVKLLFFFYVMDSHSKVEFFVFILLNGIDFRVVLKLL